MLSLDNPFTKRLAQKEQGISQEEMKKQNPQSSGNPFLKRLEEKSQEPEEGFWKNAARTAYQIPSGIAQAVTYPLDLLQAIGTGSAMDEEELEQLERIHEQQGKTFDREAYMRSLEEASSMFPTQGNAERYLEEEYGLPLQAKTGFQKGLKFASTGGTLAGSKGLLAGKNALKYEPMGIRGVNFALPRPVLGAGLEATKEGLEYAGIPEPLAELASFGILKKPTADAGQISIGKKTKPSGLVERQYESTTQPKEISQGKLNKINQKVESDFREISDKIIKESPVGETFENLKSDPTFKRDSRELLNQAQEYADSIQGSLPTKAIKKEIADTAAKQVKGFALSEYDKNYMKYMKESIEDILPQHMTHGELVEQYRKNNASLGEYFEPGSSKAQNRAKRDAILDFNRSIANVIEKSDPELSKIFKEGNERWTKIMDAEAIDSFVSDIFEGKVNHKKVNDFFDKSGYDRIFKRALGEKGYKDFEVLMKDMLTSETPYKMLKIAKKKGWSDLFHTAEAFVLHPGLGKATLAYKAAKQSAKFLMNSMLDKPKLAITWKKGVDNVKKGKFQAATKDFEELNKVIKPDEIIQEQGLIGMKGSTEKPKKTFDINVEANIKNPSKKEDLSSIGEMGKAISDNFYEGILKSLKEGKDTFSGVKDPLIQAAKPSFEAGLIKNTDDLKKFAQFYNKNKP